MGVTTAVASESNRYQHHDLVYRRLEPSKPLDPAQRERRRHTTLDQRVSRRSSNAYFAIAEESPRGQAHVRWKDISQNIRRTGNFVGESLIRSTADSELDRARTNRYCTSATIVHEDLAARRGVRCDNRPHGECHLDAFCKLRHRRLASGVTCYKWVLAYLRCSRDDT